jgi:hypothetical protein
VKVRLTLLLLLLSFALPGWAQKKNEVGLLLGGIFTPDQTGQTTLAGRFALKIDPGLSFQATYARHLWGKGTALYLEIPFVATPSTDVSSVFTQAPRNYASLFITPGLRVKFAADKRVAPWLSVGGGYGRFDESTTRLDGTPNTGQRGTDAGTVQFGAGVDLDTGISILVPIGLRLEVRDFYAQRPNYNATVSESFQHDVVVSGGLVLRF